MIESHPFAPDDKDEPPELTRRTNPTTRKIVFWPDDVPEARANWMVAEHRATTLFGTVGIEDPLGQKQSDDLSASSSKTASIFDLAPSAFLRRAQRMRPDQPEATASAFAQWIYSLYSKATGTEEDREKGKAAEQDIFNQRAKIYANVDNNLLRNIYSEWRIIHNGLHLEGRERPAHFKINNLKVKRELLRASPDLIYRNEIHSEVIIVEIKFTDRPIPINLWPNVWAQLWCYSQIGIAQNAKKLTVIGEVWGEKYLEDIQKNDPFHGQPDDNEYYYSKKRGQFVSRFPQTPLLCLRASVRRNPRAPAFDRFFRTLFDIYRGNF